MLRNSASVTPVSFTPPNSSTPLTRTATLVRNALWASLLVALVVAVALYFRYAPHVVPMVGSGR